MKNFYKLVMENQISDNLKQIKKLSEEWFEVYMKNQTTVSSQEKRQNERQIKTLEIKLKDLMKRFNMSESDISNAFEDSLKRTSKKFGMEIQTHNGLDILVYNLDTEKLNSKSTKSLDEQAKEEFGNKMSEYVMLYSK